MMLGPSAEPSWPGGTGRFCPEPTQDLVSLLSPPCCNLFKSPPNPPSSPPAPSSDVGCELAPVVCPASPPRNRAPEASKAPRASSKGLPMPPGAAERIISSSPDITFLHWVENADCPTSVLGHLASIDHNRSRIFDLDHGPPISALDGLWQPY